MKIKVIVNPNAGKRTIQQRLEPIMGRLLYNGTIKMIDVTRTEFCGQAIDVAAKLSAQDYDLIIACGGDGTVNEVVNGIMQSGSRIPIAILGAGTSNDFASALGLPDNVDDFCAMVEQPKYKDIDIGCANGRYFINVAAFGMLTSVSHTTDQIQKNLLGKLAYYRNALRELPVQISNSMQLSIDAEGFHDEGSFHVCLVVNSMSVGSMRNLMYRADVSDGVLDVLLLKKERLIPTTGEIIRVIAKSGSTFYHLQPNEDGNGYSLKPTQNKKKEPAIIYFQTPSIKFSSPQNESIITDLDGEKFGTLPLNIKVVPKAIKLMLPSQAPDAIFHNVAWDRLSSIY